MENLPTNDLIDVYVEEDDFLLSPYYKHELAKRLVALNKSRKGTSHWLMDTIYDHLLEGGKIYDGDGDEIFIYDDIVWDAYFDDTSHCFNTDVKRFADRMPIRRTPERMILRLQLFDAAFWIIGEPIERPE